MKNFKKVAIVLAVIILVIVVLIVFRDHWIGLVDSFLGWIQGLMGVPTDKQWHMTDTVKDTSGGGVF